MPRKVVWLKGALKDFRTFPELVQDRITTALRFAAQGEIAGTAKPMKGVGPGVFELALAHRGNAYRAVYAV